MVDLSRLIPSNLTDVNVPSVSNIEANRLLKKSVRKASGFVDFGAVPVEAKDESNVAYRSVNEGVWTQEDHNLALYTVDNMRDVFLMGAAHSDTVSMSGLDKSPMIDMDGVDFYIEYLHTPDSTKNINLVKLLPAPDGTVVVNKLTGVATTYLTPQEAFDFITTNSNFRTSVASWTAGNAASLAVTSGEMTITNNGNTLGEMSHATARLSAGKEYEIEIYVSDSPVAPTLHYQTQGGDVVLPLVLGKNTFHVESDLNNAEVFVRSNSSASGGYIKLTRFAIRPIELEVVTSPVDSVAFESFFEFITKDSPEVFHHGIIQSRPSLIEGIGTIDPTKPDSYFAAYDGDTASRGTCLDFFSLTDQQQQLILNNPKHNVYPLGDGVYGQKRFRQISVRGTGNGDWYVDGKALLGRTHDSYGASKYGYFPETSGLGVQGKDNVRNWNAGATEQKFYAQFAPENKDEYRVKGLFTGLTNTGGLSDRSDDGKVHLQHVFSVPRLNTGVADRSNNPFGTARCCNIVSGNVQGSVAYHDINPASTTVARTQSECFAQFIKEGNVASLGLPGRYRDASNNDSGTVESGISGRLDGKLTGVVYSEGVGGIIDYRLKATTELNDTDYSSILFDAKVGRYRGLETIKRSLRLRPVGDRSLRFVGAPSTMTVGVTGSLYSKDHSDATYKTNLNLSTVTVGDYGTLLASDAWFKFRVTAVQTNDDVVQGIHFKVVKVSSNFAVNTYFEYTNGFYADIRYPTVVCGIVDTGVPVSGEFHREDTYGEVNRILSDDMLKDGWLGGYVDVQPDGSGKEFNLTRKMYEATSTRHSVYSRDSGTSWTYATATDTDVVENAVSAAIQADEYGVWAYNAWASVTKETDGSTRKVLNGIHGINKVDYISNYFNQYGNLLKESLTGDYARDADNGAMGTLSVDHFLLTIDQRLNPNTTHRPRVPPLENRYSAASYKNATSGVRYIPHLSDYEGYLTVAFLSEEIVWDNNTDNIAEATAVASNVSHGFSKGVTYSFNGGNLVGKAFVALSTATYTPDTQLVEGDDGLYTAGGDLVFERWGGNGYGYEVSMDVPTSGTIKTDENGNDVLVSYRTLALPMGHL